MSHEIRTPMNGVLGMTDLLLETDLSGSQRDYAQTVRNSGEALLVIIDDILDFSKVEAGKTELDHVGFSLRTVVEDVRHLLAVSARTKGLAELVAVVDDAVPNRVVGDPGRTRQVLINLIGNAIKFTPHGEVILRVTAPEVEDDGALVRFEISDTGIGIAPEKLDLIFQPFAQADSFTSKNYGGTGLGLAISGQLVALMGGQCGVSSEVGEGSTFWFTIRVSTREALAPPSPPPLRIAPVLHHATPRAAPQGSQIAGHTQGRLLLAEDNLINQKVAVAVLTKAGYIVDTVLDGAAAVSAAAAYPYDAVLMDCQMPVMNGYEATAAIRIQEGFGRRVPIIALTAAARDEDRERCLAEGMDGYLPKPISKEALLALITESVTPLSLPPSTGTPDAPSSSDHDE